MRLPWKTTSPELGLSIPPSRFSKVVLPEPEGPMIAMKSPFGMSMSKASKIVMLSRPRV